MIVRFFAWFQITLDVNDRMNNSLLAFLSSKTLLSADAEILSSLKSRPLKS